MLTRSEYWIRIIATTVAMMIYFLFVGLFFSDSIVMLLIGVVIAVVLSIAQLVWAVQRIHDVGLHGAWLLISFVPIVGSIVFYVLMLLPTDHFYTEDDGFDY